MAAELTEGVQQPKPHFNRKLPLAKGVRVANSWGLPCNNYNGDNNGDMGVAATIHPRQKPQWQARPASTIQTQNNKPNQIIMPLKRIPTPSQDAGNWGTILNDHLAQTQNPLNGAFNSFDVFSARPTNLTADDAGRTYLYTQTGNWHEWSGTEWKVQNKSEINVKDYGAVGNGVVDDTTPIQNAINYACSVSEVADYYSGMMPMVILPNGKYAVKNLIINNNYSYCGIEGRGLVKLIHIGSGALLTVGNGSSNGILPTQIKNITFEGKGRVPGSIGLKVDISAGGHYESIGFEGFDIGLFNRSGINCTFDFQRRLVANCNTGILFETAYGSEPTLRFDCNVSCIKNAIIGRGTINGFVCKNGISVNPSTGNGLVKVEYCDFENMDSAGVAIFIERNGETYGADILEIDHCWFENFGVTALKLVDAKARMQNCFIAGGTDKIIDGNAASKLILSETFGYFLDKSPAGGLIQGDITDYKIIDCGFQGLSKLTSSYPVTDAGIVTKQECTYKINYNANYPIGNNNYNYNLSFNLISEADKVLGPSWTLARIDFAGSDGLSNGIITLQIYKLGSIAIVDLTKIGVGVTYQINNNIITFLNDGTGSWYNMNGYYSKIGW